MFPARPACSLMAAGMAAAAIPLTASGQVPAAVVRTTFHMPSSTIDVPGVGPRVISSYNGLFRSPGGNRWICIANLTGDSTTNRVIIAGTTAPGDRGAVIVRKGGPIPGSTRTLNILDNPRINDAGQFAFSSNSSGTGTPSVFFFTGSIEPGVTYAVAAAITDPIPFLPGSTYTGGFNSTLLDNTGRWGFAGSILTGGVVDRAVFFNGAVVARSADAPTAPMMLPGSPGEGIARWSDFTLRRVFVDATGNQFYWHGTAMYPDGAGTVSVDVAAKNNVSVAQEGVGLPIPDGQPVIASFVSGWFEPGGDWFLRGTLAASATDVVLRNGQIVAQRGQPILPGSDVQWDRVTSGSASNGFLFNVGSDNGHHVIAGNTFDTLSGTRRTVAVLDGLSIAAQRGHPIDLDGNGLTDDDAFIAGFRSETGPGTAFLTSAGELWMVVPVENGASAALGDALVRIGGLFRCPGDFNGVGGVTVQDIFDFLAAYFSGDSRADFNGVGGVTVQDVFDFLAAWFTPCP